MVYDEAMSRAAGGRGRCGREACLTSFGLWTKGNVLMSDGQFV